MRAAGFEIKALEIGYMPGPKPWTYMYQGAGQEPGTRASDNTGDASFHRAWDPTELGVPVAQEVAATAEQQCLQRFST